MTRDEVEALFWLCADATSTAQVRKLLTAHGPVDPWGAGNAKTGAPGTYRPVRNAAGQTTCPTTCALRDRGCYAQNGRAAMAQRRATGLTDAAIRAAIGAFIEAARWSRPARWIPVRLHVSGDFLNLDGELDLDYIEALGWLTDLVRSTFGAPGDAVLAWTYTHSRELSENPTLIDGLRQAGIVVRTSGALTEWGVVTLPNTVGAAASARQVGATYCPAQAGADIGVKVTCLGCRLCWTRSRPIAFRPDHNTRPPADGIVPADVLPN